MHGAESLPSGYVARSMVLTIGLLAEAGCGGMPQSLGGEGVAGGGTPKYARDMVESYVGLTTPHALYTYRPEYAGRVPEDCGKPAWQLASIAAMVRKDCSVEHVIDPRVGEILTWTCDIRTHSNGCRDVYEAQVWAEKATDGTTENTFVIQSLARAVRHCKRADPNAPDIVYNLAAIDADFLSEAQRVSTPLQDFFDACVPASPAKESPKVLDSDPK